MSAWDSDDIARIAHAEELEIASRRNDGTLRRPRTIWVVRDGDDLYVRSVNGPSAAWYRGTRDQREGLVHAGGVAADVDFVDADHGLDDRIDAAYRAKYHRYSVTTLNRITSSGARSTTIRLVPRQASS
jgi:hypothetical protein